MRTRLFAASAAALTAVVLGVSAGPSRAQTPSTVFVGVVTVTSPPVVAVPPNPNPQVTGARRTVSCRTYYREHGKRRHVTKRICRKRHVSAVATRRTVQTVNVPQPTFVVPPPATFVVAPPPPVFVVTPPPPVFVVTPPPPVFVVTPPPPVFVVTLAVAPVTTNRDHDDHEPGRAKHEKKSKVRGEGKEKSKEKSKGRGHDD